MCSTPQQWKLQPSGPSTFRFLCRNARQADRSREAQELEQVAQHQGDQVQGGWIKRVFAAGLGLGLIWERRQLPAPPPAPPPGQLVVRRRRAAEGHLNDKGAAAGWEGAGEGPLAEPAPPAFSPAAAGLSLHPAAQRFGGAGAAREPRRSAVFARGWGGGGGRHAEWQGWSRDKGPDLTDPAGGEGEGRYVGE